MINWIIGGLIIAATVLIIINRMRGVKKGQCCCNCTGCGMQGQCMKK